MSTHSKKIKFNLISVVLCQTVTIAIGFLLPRIYIENFGSSVNGVLSTIKQIFTYLCLLEAGVGLASAQALFGPVARGVASIPSNTGESVSAGVMDRFMCFDNDYSDEEKAAITTFFDYFYDDARYTEWVDMEGFLPATKTGGEALAAANEDMASSRFIARSSAPSFQNGSKRSSNRFSWKTAGININHSSNPGVRVGSKIFMLFTRKGSFLKAARSPRGSLFCPSS